MRLYELRAGALNPSNCSVPARFQIPIGGFPDSNTAHNFALRWRGKNFKGLMLALRQAQGERVFPLVVSLSNHERLLLTHPIR